MDEEQKNALDEEYLSMQGELIDVWKQMEDFISVDTVDDGSIVVYTTAVGRMEADPQQVILSWLVLQKPQVAIRFLRRFLQEVEEKYESMAPDLRVSIMKDIAFQLGIVLHKLQQEEAAEDNPFQG